MALPQVLLDRILDPAPALLVKFRPESNETPRTIAVEHVPGPKPTEKCRAYLDFLQNHSALHGFLEFFQKHNGLQLCRTLDSKYGEVRPLLELMPLERIQGFTDRYKSGGDRAWTIDLNKSKGLYRSSAPWLAFAEVDSGPMCLTILLEGHHAGSIFFLAPQPQFNILRPIAKDFNALLERIAKDMAAFLRLVRARVTLRGPDGHNYGFAPVAYLRERGTAT